MSDDRLHEATSDARRKLGRDDLADNLDGVAPEPEPVEDEGDKFLRELREASSRNSVSIPGLLDE
jgi:hypothetical protein